jgi:hypothetical protein
MRFFSTQSKLGATLRNATPSIKLVNKHAEYLTVTSRILFSSIFSNFSILLTSFFKNTYNFYLSKQYAVNYGAIVSGFAIYCAYGITINL